MKRLDVTYKTNGSEYTLFRRGEEVAIYKQVIDGIYVGAEMFKIQIRKRETIKGKEYPERETPPNNDSWGETSFTLSRHLTDEQLIERFERYERELKQQREAKLLQTQQN